MLKMFNGKYFYKRFFTTSVFLIIFTLLTASSVDACFSIVVGKDASADGFVLVAHNEDDSPPQIINHHKIPGQTHQPHEKVKLTNGGSIEQASVTFSYIWSEMPETDYSDSFINEWGLCICSNSCPSKEDRAEITEGGIGKMLRYIIAQRAKTARQGVLLAGDLVEKFGYLSSGRTYIIADPNEGWLFCAINGKHWIAQRVPDNHVAMVANTYTIHQVDISDSNNFLASSDIVEYAIKKGWYDPSKNGSFDFAAAYANPENAKSPINYARQWAGLSHISKDKILIGPLLPFSVKPEEKIDVFKLMEILRFDDIQEKPELMKQCSKEEKGACIICRGTTQTSFIAQLRNNMPRDIGIVYWLCLSQPASSFYIPFYFGIDKFPQGYCLESRRPTKKEFEQKINAPFKPDPNQAFWTFSNYSSKVRDKSDMGIAFGNKLFFSIMNEFNKLSLSIMNEFSKKILEECEKQENAEFEIDPFSVSQDLYHLSLEFMKDIINEPN